MSGTDPFEGPQSVEGRRSTSDRIEQILEVGSIIVCACAGGVAIGMMWVDDMGACLGATGMFVCSVLCG